MQRRWRLAKRTDFQTVYRIGKSYANSQFVVYFRKNTKIEQFRLGVSVSKKLGSAVVRNRLRRMMKEIIRHQAEHMPAHTDLVLIARKPAAGQDYKQMEKSLLHVLRKAKLLEPSIRRSVRINDSQ